MKKVNQARVVLFTVLPEMDNSERPGALVVASLWGEVLVSGVEGLLETSDDQRETVRGWKDMQSFFSQTKTAYITEKEDPTLRYMAKMGITLDEATITGLETWHVLDQSFCPAVALEFGHLWVRMTATFRGTTSSGWAWHKSDKEGMKELAPDQARLAFAIGNAMASLTLDGIVARIDPEDVTPLSELGAVVIRSEQEGILEGDETLGMRALRLEQQDELGLEPDEAGLKVGWDNLQVAYQEPFGRISKGQVSSIPEQQEARILERHEEVMTDLVKWEESISFITLLGPQHQRPTAFGEFRLPDAPEQGILRGFDRGRDPSGQ